VNDQTRVFLGVAAGALVGAVVTAVCLTERGRGGLARLDDAMDELTDALSRFRGTIRKASAAMDEGRGLAGDVRAVVLEPHPFDGPRRAS